MKVSRVLITAAEIDRKLEEMGAAITRDYAGKRLLMIGILKGAFMVMADLARNVKLPIEFDFMAVSSYLGSTHSSGVVRILKDLDQEIGGCHVLIVEDIIDTGLTLQYLIKTLRVRQPASLELAALLVKDGVDRPDIEIKYEGFHIPPDFVIGYGLDFDERYRNLPYVGVMGHGEGDAADDVAAAFELDGLT